MPSPRKRKLSAAETLRKHSPIKRGLKIKNEDRPLEPYTKIASRLYLGNYQAAKDPDFFKKRNITAVLNCSNDIPNHFQKNSKIEYLRIPIDDSLKEKDFEKLYKLSDLAVGFIDKHININKGNIFVHCYAGRQRSAGCVAMYLIKNHKMTPTEACKYILDKRKEAFHFGLSLNFEKSIVKYAKSLCKK